MWSCDIYLHMTRTEQRRQRAITIFRHVRSTMGCQTCGEKDPVVLELHHVIPIGKDRTRNFQSLTTVENDLALCTVVCANCHLRIGAKTIQSSPAMEKKSSSRLCRTIQEENYIPHRVQPCGYEVHTSASRRDKAPSYYLVLLTVSHTFRCKQNYDGESNPQAPTLHYLTLTTRPSLTVTSA